MEALIALLRLSVQDPQRGARVVLGLGLSIQTRWTAFALMVVGSAIAIHVSFALQAAEINQDFGPLMASPFRTSLLQGLVLLTAVAAIHVVGRALGGRGRFDDSLLLVAWLQFVLLCVQVVQIAAQILFPMLAAVLGLLAMALTLWLLTHFVVVLHGFTSAIRVFFGIILAAILLVLALAFGLAIVLGPIGG